MEIKRTFVYYLSGTGSTKKYALAIAKNLPGKVRLEELDPFEYFDEQLGPEDLLVVCSPVYAGHIPPTIWKQLEDIKCNGTLALGIAVYGSCSYGSALLEMQSELQKKGCVLVGAAALVARHSIIQTVASNRPTGSDLQEAKSFAINISERIAAMQSANDAPRLEFPGELPEKVEPVGIVPVVSEGCSSCYMCAIVCPSRAIPDNNPSTTSPEKCISCLHCLDICPTKARVVPSTIREMVKGMLDSTAQPTRPNEYYGAND